MLQLVTSEPVEWLAGDQVIQAVVDLLRERLPRVPADDPHAGTLQALASLGRSVTASNAPMGAA